MAPRTAKAKKATEVSEAPKKGRGKAKNVEEAEPEIEEADLNEKAVAPVAEKKKRGKKAAGDANGAEENGKPEETAPPAKKGRKKNVEEPVPEGKEEEKSESNDQSGEDDAAIPDDEKESNGDAKEIQSAPSSRGRKKPTKKEPAVKAETKPSRGRKAKQEIETEESVEHKPKAPAKGRGRKAQPKVEQETEEDKEEEAKAEPPPTKGRKKAQPKPVKEKTPESEEQEAEDDESQENEEEPLKKKETKTRNQGKKAPIKEDSEEGDGDVEEMPAKKRKVNKKEEKGKGDAKDEDVEEEEIPEPKPKGRGRGKKPAEPSAEPEEIAQDAGEATSKRRRKVADDKAPADDKKKAPKNKALTNYEELDFSNNSKSIDGKDWNFKISSWNVDGIRAWMNKGGLDYLSYEKPDILCLQETKCAKDKLPDELANLAGYHAYWECSEKDGYAGVGIYTAQLAMNVQYGLQNEELDNEGRIITAEYEQFYLICTYVPNAGKKLVTLPKRLQWNEEFRKFVKELDKKKPVIICGDMNVSHQEIDLRHPKPNRKNAGFTDEERAGMTELLGDGFVDTFRHLYPDKTDAYTFWTYMSNARAKNVGWRLDYFIVSERLLPGLCDNVIRDQVYGSDHCPITLFLHLKGADKPKE